VSYRGQDPRYPGNVVSNSSLDPAVKPRGDDEGVKSTVTMTNDAREQKNAFYFFFAIILSMDKILFFDGVCAMCNGLVAFLFRRDKEHRFKFAPLQGQAAQERIPEYAHGDLNTVVFLDEKGRFFTESDAIICAIASLGGFGKAILLLNIFPKFLRDGVYRMVAKNRYRWFGTTPSCALLTKEQRKQVLD
jgi:predicted DCC family thiol-disulfide oxidoreductase YuxK